MCAVSIWSNVAKIMFILNISDLADLRFVITMKAFYSIKNCNIVG